MRTLKKTSAAMLLALAAMATGQAASASVTTHSALECFGSNRFDGLSLLFAAVSSQADPGQVSKVFCPLTRPNASSAGDIGSIKVDLWDRNPEGATLFRARSCNANASACQWSSAAGTGEAFEGRATLLLGSVGAYTSGYAIIDGSMDVVPSGNYSDYRLFSYQSDD